VHAEDMHADDLVRRPVDEHLTAAAEGRTSVATPIARAEPCAATTPANVTHTQRAILATAVSCAATRKSAAIESDRCAGRTFM
jgi:hypothetical protein